MTHRRGHHGLYIFGFGGHARSVLDVAISAGWDDAVFIDDNAVDGEHFSSYRALREFPATLVQGWEGFPAAGDNARRRAQVERTTISLANVISPHARLGLEATLGRATFVGHGAHVGPGARIGTGVILNTQSLVEHETAIGDFSHISINATVAGRSRIGRNVTIGAGAVVIDSIAVCDDVYVGAGAVVTADISEPGVYVGIPARRIGSPRV